MRREAGAAQSAHSTGAAARHAATTYYKRRRAVSTARGRARGARVRTRKLAYEVAYGKP
jgi:predicted aspartyl protease